MTQRDAHRLVGLCERHGIAYRFNGRDPWHSSRWVVPVRAGAFVVWTSQGDRRNRSTYEDVRRRLVRAFDLPNTAR